MITVLIPVLKQGFLEAQLSWLSKQTYKGFTVIAMDSYYNITRNQPWARKQYPFTFHHVPLIQNIDFPKRFDYSIKNNLALLAMTDHFIFISDTDYPTEGFVEAAFLNRNKRERYIAFEVKSVSAGGFDSFNKTVDLGGVTDHMATPAFLFNSSTFFYGLNGFDEALTYASGYEFIADRMLNMYGPFDKIAESLYHIVHAPNQNNFGKRAQVPCEKCDRLFASWKFSRAYDTGEFPLEGPDSDMMEQMISRDAYFGLSVFQCPNCGFGGALNPTEHEKMVKWTKGVDAPTKAFEGRVGRNLGKVFETMNKQVGTDMNARLAYLMTTY